MKNNKEYFANRRNTPHLGLNRFLIGFAYTSMALNLFIVFIYSRYVINWENSAIILSLSILMLVLVPIMTKDPRRGNVDLLAVFGDYIMLTLITIAIIIFGKIYWIVGIYLIEMLIVLIAIMQHVKKTKY